MPDSSSGSSVTQSGRCHVCLAGTASLRAVQEDRRSADPDGGGRRALKTRWPLAVDPRLWRPDRAAAAPPRGSQPPTWIKLLFTPKKKKNPSSRTCRKSVSSREPHVALGTKFNKCSIPLVHFLSQKKSFIQLPVSGMVSIFPFSSELPWKSALKPKPCDRSQLKRLWTNRAKEQAGLPEEAWTGSRGMVATEA